MYPDARQVASSVPIRDVLQHLKWRQRARNRADCKLCQGKATGTLAFTELLWHCHRCHAGGDVFSLIRTVNRCGFSDALAYAADLTGVQRKPFSCAVNKGVRRGREHLERVVEKLAAEERRLRIVYADEVRMLEGLQERVTHQLWAQEDETANREWLLVDLPTLARRAMAAYNIVAFATAAQRIRFVLRPAAREEMIDTSLLDGVLSQNGSVVEVCF